METHLPNKFHHAHWKSHVRLCSMRRDNLTNQRTNLVHYIYMFFGHSEMPEEGLSSKYFCIITVLHDCIPKQLASTSESNDCIYSVKSALSETQVIYYIYIIIFRY